VSSDAAVQQLLQQAVQAEFEGRFDEAVTLLRRSLDYTDSPLAFTPLRDYALAGQPCC
jgi:hypothetical protein